MRIGEKMEKDEITQKLEKAFMSYCYDILEVNFPDRGFLLFWQLPLEVKLKYFEIEDRIVELKDTKSKEERCSLVAGLLEFLGANPIQKVDNAFKAKYSKGIVEYLDI